MMKFFMSAALALLLAALPASTFAQGEQGRIAGIVRDSEQRVRRGREGDGQEREEPAKSARR